MNTKMNNRYVHAMQWGGLAAGIICALVALWGYFGGWLNIGWVITLAYCEMCSLMVSFCAWYCRWYWSDDFIERTARHAVKYELDPGFVEAAIESHPRKADIWQEIGKQSRQ